MQLGAIIHATADKSYEDLRVLQSECINATDIERKRKIIDFCETQRHRAIQLLALSYWAENEAEVLQKAIEGVGEKATARLEKYRHSFWTLDNAVKKFEIARMPKFDVATAANCLVNEAFDGFPLIVDAFLKKGNGDDEDDEASTDAGDNETALRKLLSSKRTRTLKDRVLSRLLSEEINLKNDQTKKVLVTDEGELCVDCIESAGYSVKLALDSVYNEEEKILETMWYATWIRIQVRSGEKATGGDAEYQFIPHKHIPIIGKELEAYLQEGKNESVIQSLHVFMRALCGSLAFQLLDSQSKSVGVEVERTTDHCKVPLNINDWFLLVRRQTAGKAESVIAELELLSYHLLHGSQEYAVSTKLDGSDLDDLSLRRLIAAALRDAAKHQLEQLREAVLAHNARHHPSQARVRLVSRDEAAMEHAEYYLELKLFHDSAVLALKMGRDGAFEMTTTSKAQRWGFDSAQEAMTTAVHTMKVTPTATWGSIISQLWDRAEAWDCLASVSISGLTSQRCAFLPPDVEIARRHNPSLPSAYWSLGCFEGVRYFFAIRYISSPSGRAFHSSFLPLKQRINDATLCEVVSMELPGDSAKTSRNAEQEGDSSRAYRAEKLVFTDLAGLDDVHRVVRRMRQAWAEQKFRMFELSFAPDAQGGQEGLWFGGNSEEIQSLSPYRLVFSDEADESIVSCKIMCKASSTDTFACKRTESLGAIFADTIRKRGILRRLASCANDTVNIILVEAENHCRIIWPGRSEEEMIMVGFRNGKTLAVIGTKPHPLEKLVAQELNRDSSVQSFDMMLSLLHDSNLIIRAAEQYAKTQHRGLHVTASSITNLHFFLDHETLPKQSFDSRLELKGRATVWNRLGWSPTSLMMSPETVGTVAKIVDALK